MKASFVDLRNRSKEIIQALRRNERVTVLYRGKPAAIMQPVRGARTSEPVKASDHAAFGLWAKRRDLKDPAAYVRTLREGRFGAV